MRKNFCIFLSVSIVLLLGACQRNNMTYGGVEQSDDSPAYSHELNINQPAVKN